MFRIPHKKHINPEEQANWLSRLFFVWIFGVINFFRPPTIAFRHFYFLPLEEDKAQFLGNEIARLWRLRLERDKTSLTPVIAAMFYKRFCICSILLSFQVLLLLLTIPIVVYKLLCCIEEEPMKILETNEIYLIVCLICCSILNMFLFHHCKLALHRIGIRAKVALENLLFRKMLSVGAMHVNYRSMEHSKVILSSRIGQLAPIAFFLNFLWLSPIQLGLILWQMHKIGGFVPVYVFGMVSVPIIIVKGFLLFLHDQTKSKRNHYTTNRLKYLTEFIHYFREVKMYCCEMIYEKYIEKYRSSELRAIVALETLYIFRRFCMLVYPFVTTIMTIFLYRHYNISYLISQLFTIFMFFTLTQLYCGRFFLRAVRSLILYRRVVKSVEQFLTLPERSTTAHFSISAKDYPLGYIRVSEMSIRSEGQDILDKVDFEVQPGELCVVVGVPRSGKTALIKALINEAPVYRGNVYVIGKVSYCSQDRWIFDSSIRQNILFGQPYHKRRYSRVVNMCQLEQHLIDIPAGDRALIRNITMTEVLKTKIDFARALYNEADIYIFDQPFHALDAVNALTLFRNCIQYFLRGKTRIIVSAHFNYLSRADVILAINEGQLLACNNIKEVMKFMNRSEMDIEDMSLTALDSPSIISSLADENDDYDIAHFQNIFENFQSSMYKAYCSYVYGDSGWIRLSVILLLAAQVLLSYGDYYLLFWAGTHNKCSAKLEPEINEEQCLKPDAWKLDYYLYFLSGRTACMWLNLMYFSMTRINYAKRVHKDAMLKLLEAKAEVYIFDADIYLNFQQAMQILDFRLTRHAIITLPYMLRVFGAMMLMIHFWIWSIIPVFIFVVLANILVYFFSYAATQLEYMQMATRNSSVAYVRTTVQGIETIRAFKSEQTVTHEYETLQDDTTAALVMSLTLNDFVGFYIHMLCILYLILFFAVYSQLGIYDNISIAVLAYIFEHYLNMLLNLHYSVRHTALVIYDVACTQNLINYANMESEGPFFSHPVDKPPDAWPETGLIEFCRVSVIYKSPKVDPVRDLNLTIEDNEKVALLGRVGSGKSTIIGILFNIFRRTGNVYVDGLHIDDVGLYELRAKISIVPKIPFIISCSLRRNIDIFGEFNDNAIANVLDQVGIEYVSLDQTVCNDDYSYSEKQLICLARVLLHPNKIIVIYESEFKSSTRADSMIHDVIRKNFNNNTVIVVSNKLGNLMYMNRIVIVDKGQIVEDGEPKKLMARTSKVLQPFLKAYLTSQMKQLSKGNSIADLETMQLEMATSTINAINLYRDSMMGSDSNTREDDE